MAEKSRTYNSIVNSLFGIGASIITVLLNFVLRVVLVKTLGEETNGLYALFQSITNVMLITELGISSAMIIHLYEPVKLRDEEKIGRIMAFYKKTYTIFALCFLGVTLIVDFLLIDKLITSTIPLSDIRLYFFIFALSFVLNYLTYYKRSVLFADQKNRVSIGVTSVCEVVFRGAQIALLLLFRNYIVFLVLLVAEKTVSNVICNFYVNKNYPFLKDLSGKKILPEEKQGIINTVKPLFVNQLSSTVQQSSESILISILLGSISIVGYYGNYQLVISAVKLAYSQFGGAITSGFGNLAVSGDAERLRNAYKKSTIALDFVACIICCGFVSCIQDFIYLVFGTNFVLANGIVWIMTATLLVYLFNIPVISIQNACGLHRLDAIGMIIQAVATVALGYVLGYFFGMSGILIGTLVPLVVFSLINKGLAISKKALAMSPWQYFAFVSAELLKIILPICLSVFVNTSLIHMDASVMSILVKGIVAVVISTCVYSILSLRNRTFRSLVNLLIKKVGA